METKFSEILKRIDPEKIHIPIEKIMNSILANYKFDKTEFKNWDECDETLDNFFKEVYKEYTNLPDDYFKDEDRIPRDYFFRLIKRKYTDIEMYSIMMNGTQGGVYQIFKTIINEMIHDMANNEVREIVQEYLDDKEFDRLERDAREYITKFDYLVPREFKETPTHIISKFSEILIKHGWALKKVRDLNQTA